MSQLRWTVAGLPAVLQACGNVRSKAAGSGLQGADTNAVCSTVSAHATVGASWMQRCSSTLPFHHCFRQPACMHNPAHTVLQVKLLLCLTVVVAYLMLWQILAIFTTCCTQGCKQCSKQRALEASDALTAEVRLFHQNLQRHTFATVDKG